MRRVQPQPPRLRLAGLDRGPAGALSGHPRVHGDAVEDHAATLGVEHDMARHRAVAQRNPDAPDRDQRGEIGLHRRGSPSDRIDPAGMGPFDAIADGAFARSHGKPGHDVPPPSLLRAAQPARKVGRPDGGTE
ncbi:hypothetical protein JAN5088_01264 [Jannaschia rubra]|uniref:Uncharacterized protein n=1 Tax=Jannaschia rubra TaxID=282197 RepID=A0A0M6XQM1_9RHOB|nr:hypothetical protein [Jannaschia rubra]CTQ32493.1 hypothetical protein JAN5088_01264 [Jannaschia rubra]